MSVVTYLELVYGALKSQHPRENLAQIEHLRGLIPVLPLETDAAIRYGRLRAELERKGTLIGALDMLIASHALALGLTLVTNNVREFGRVPRLTVENWTERETN
jgi:tRNA(fMet)-specific endonuclease VapC